MTIFKFLKNKVISRGIKSKTCALKNDISYLEFFLIVDS